MERAIELYGDRIWEAICDHFPPDQMFTAEECVPLIEAIVGKISRRYAHELARGTLLTVLDQGNGAVVRHGRMRWSV